MCANAGFVGSARRKQRAYVHAAVDMFAMSEGVTVASRTRNDRHVAILGRAEESCAGERSLVEIAQQVLITSIAHQLEERRGELATDLRQVVSLRTLCTTCIARASRREDVHGHSPTHPLSVTVIVS